MDWRPSPSMAVALVALFISLTGTAFAADPKFSGKGLAPNSVGTRELKPNAVKAPDIAPDAVTSTALAPEAVTPASLAPGAVTSPSLAWAPSAPQRSHPVP